MAEVFVVRRGYVYDTPNSNYSTCIEEHVEKIFDTEEKAVEYIRAEIKDRLEYAESLGLRDEYIEAVPPAEEIIKDRGVAYRIVEHEWSGYVYDLWNVE